MNHNTFCLLVSTINSKVKIIKNKITVDWYSRRSTQGDAGEKPDSYPDHNWWSYVYSQMVEFTVGQGLLWK